MFILHTLPNIVCQRRGCETLGLHNFQLQAMMKRVVHSLGLLEHTERNPRSKNQLRGTKASPDFSLPAKDIFVRIVHAGGQQELYQHAIPASKLMAKHPGMCVARPEVFRAPHQSVLWPEERLLPGHQYIIISSRDLEKLKRKHPDQGKTMEPNREVAPEALNSKITRSSTGHKPKENGKLCVPNGGAGQEMMDTRTTVACKIQEKSEEVKEANGLGEEKENEKGGGVAGESFCSAKEFYVVWPRRKGIKGKKPFVPPLPKARSYRGLGWQPRLPTVQELSP